MNYVNYDDVESKIDTIKSNLLKDELNKLLTYKKEHIDEETIPFIKKFIQNQNSLLLMVILSKIQRELEDDIINYNSRYYNGGNRKKQLHS